MKKDTVIQFVGFATKLDFEEFLPQWKEYVSQFMKLSGTRLVQRQMETKNSFKYISQHELPDTGFRFNFMKGRNSEHFPEQRVKVIQAGGYIPLQIEYSKQPAKGQVKLMVLISHNEYDIDFYRQTPLITHLNIYQAYYENCTYSHILEVFTTEANAPLLLEQLQSRTGTDAALYKDCELPKQRSLQQAH